MQHTALYPLYAQYQGKLVEFAGYEMPVQYHLGVKSEHLWCRQHAGLFDISHMGQAWLQGGTAEEVAEALEELVGADLQALPSGKQQYTQLLNEQGCILDDLIVTKPREMPDRLYMVVNAACKQQDFSYMQEKLADRISVESMDDRALLALQGPEAVAVAQQYFPGVEQLTFMSWKVYSWQGNEIYISRSGYTGEDGIEISVLKEQAVDLAQQFLQEEVVEFIGLGARDSLRLEAGLCLYGVDMDANTSPVEAGLQWSIGKRRRLEGGFAGAEVVLRHLRDGVIRRRVGLDIQSKVPCRAGVPIYSGEGQELGEVCSGSFSPCLEKPIAMGYVRESHKKTGTAVWLKVRGKLIPATVCKMPFLPSRYVK